MGTTSEKPFSKRVNNNCTYDGACDAVCQLRQQAVLDLSRDDPLISLFVLEVPAEIVGKIVEQHMQLGLEPTVESVTSVLLAITAAAKPPRVGLVKRGMLFVGGVAKHGIKVAAGSAAVMAASAAGVADKVIVLGRVLLKKVEGLAGLLF